MSKASKNAAAESLSFEEAMKELEEIVRKLESGSSDLESSIQDYMRGTSLQKHCQQKLEQARMKVDSIVSGEGGEPELAPFSESGN